MSIKKYSGPGEGFYVLSSNFCAPLVLQLALCVCLNGNFKTGRLVFLYIYCADEKNKLL